MKVLVIGAGAVSSRINLFLQEWGHEVQAQLPTLSPGLLSAFDARVLVVVEPEAAAGLEAVREAVTAGRVPVVVGTPGGALTAWAQGSGAAVFPYPPTEADLQALRDALARLGEGGRPAEEIFRRTVLGGDVAARAMAGIAVRRIAVTSPKGGTGKTTLAVNLAALFALCGYPVYLSDLDANGGSVFYHLRMHQEGAPRGTLIGLLRRGIRPAGRDALADLAGGAAVLSAFSEIPELPTLHVLPGIFAEEVGDPELSRKEEPGQDPYPEVRMLYGAAETAGGLSIADVGINPAHPLHRAALRGAAAIAVVIKPEVPDLAQVRAWIHRMIRALAASGLSEREAAALVGSQVKVVYNMVVGDSFKSAHSLLNQALQEDGLGFRLAPHGVIPYVDPRLADAAVNSERRTDILIWRWKKERPEELAPFAEALIGFAAHFVPGIREAAAAAGLLPGAPRRRGIPLLRR